MGYLEPLNQPAVRTMFNVDKHGPCTSKKVAVSKRLTFCSSKVIMKFQGNIIETTLSHCIKNTSKKMENWIFAVFSNYFSSKVACTVHFASLVTTTRLLSVVTTLFISLLCHVG